MTGSEWEARFAGGWLTSWTAFGAELLDRPPQLELWRAPIDNDRLGLWVPAVAKEWADHGLHRLQHRVCAVAARSTDGHVEVAVTTRVAPAVLAWCVRCTYRYIFDAAGRLAIVVEGEVEGDAPSTFGRVGLAMALVPAFEEVAWYGLGPHETYPDSMTAGRLGPLPGVRRRAGDAVRRASGERPPQRRALVPASRTATGESWRWAPRSSASAPTAGPRPPWRPPPISDELVPEPRTWLHFDHRQHGLGSAACGPGPLERYVLKSGPFRFSVGLWPGSPLAVDPGPAAHELRELLREAGGQAATPHTAGPADRLAQPFIPAR